MNPTNTLLDDVVIAGSIEFENDFYCNAKVEGEVRSKEGSITIGEDSSIKGDIEAKEVILHGQVEGKIKADSTELHANSVLNGDIETKMIQMQPGAKLTGRTVVGG